MKKLLSLILIFIVCLLQMSFAKADIKIYYNNKEIVSEVSPFIENGRTLVPVRMILEALNYDVLWNDKTKTVTIKSTNSTILLSINSNIAVVNNKNITMDTKAMIKDNRTFVPIRFIAENLGYLVRWDEPTKSIFIETKTTDTKILKVYTERFSDKLHIKIESDNLISEPKKMSLYNPDRYVIDIDNAVLQTDLREINVNSEFVSKVRFSQFQISPNIVRVVVDLNKQTDIATKFIDGLFTIEINDTKPIISNITAKRVGVQDIVTISSNTLLNAENFTLFNPNRIVFDFINTDITANQLLFNGEFIDKINFYNHSDKTRVTITVKEKADYKFETNDGSFVITIFKANDQETPQNNSNALVVLDPGHGGKDPGSLGIIDGKTVLTEKEVNLYISNKVLKQLKAEGYNIISTRTTDKYLDLTARAEIANSANASLFVSIHNNAYPNETAQGTLTMYAYDTPKENMTVSGKSIATIMQNELIKGTQGQDRGLLKNSKIYVISKTNMPAILTECLFMSNPNDLQKLMDNKSLDKIAVSIATGIKEILKALN